jgi:putative ubiquitin-RnfH superfamily antitoxin RatB of RatAB toxin-antitoxin module
MANNNMVKVEVAYARPDRQCVITVEIAAGSTIEAAIRLSGILAEFPEIDLAAQKIGVFSKSCSLSDKIRGGDRIEIYRPLIIDPKEARRAKAKKQKPHQRQRNTSLD